MERYTSELFKSTLIVYLIKKYGHSKHMSVVADSTEPFRVLQTFIFKSQHS